MNLPLFTAQHPVAITAARTHAVSPALSPTQQKALDQLQLVLAAAPVVGFIAQTGCGRSTVVRALVEQCGGRLIDATDMTAAVADRPANAFEEAIGAEISKALREHELVVIDDLFYFAMPGYNASTRPGFVRTVLRQIVTQAVASGRRLVMCGTPTEAWSTAQDQFGSQAAVVTMEGFSAADYAAIGRNVAGEAAVAEIDFEVLYRYASHLHGHQLRLAFNLLKGRERLSTQDVITCLTRHVTASNTRVDEVEATTFAQLPGHEEIIDALETHIVLPMENSAVAARMGLKPKRGVLLYGPPGTGKTSIGRALAHHMRGKFFLIDGSIVSEPPAQFFAKVQRVIQEAKDNAPSVLFIDDADVLFSIEHISGLSRYLLTLLDGLESETSRNVCVMMTAMNVKLIPDALLRSGRVELWLETKVPVAAIRARILQRWMGNELPQSQALDFDELAQMTEGFTPADLRRLVADAKALCAADLARERAVRTAAAYVASAVDAFVAGRNRMADSLQDERLRLSGGSGGKYPHNTAACGW